jgi:hypothetical protein
MRRSWRGYYRVLISERPSPLSAAATNLRRRRRVLQLDPTWRTARVITRRSSRAVVPRFHDWGTTLILTIERATWVSAI